MRTNGTNGMQDHVTAAVRQESGTHRSGERDGRGAPRVRQARMNELLKELVEREGRMRASEMLGVNYRTLVMAEESGRITGRMSDALHKLLGSTLDPGLARMEKRVDGLEERVAALEERASKTAGEMQSAEDNGNELPEALPTVEGLPSPEHPRPSAPPIERRTDPTVVTMDPAEDDEQVYGAAWPLVEEWRRLRTGHARDDGSLAWLVAEERLLTLDLTMMEVHGLTLPPETQPLRGFGRRNQTVWRWEALRDTRKALPRRRMLHRLRRILTLGRWRS